MGNDRHGFTTDAKAQGCRGGAAMVQAPMMFKAQATTEDLLLSADQQSIVFSLCLPFDRAYLRVLG